MEALTASGRYDLFLVTMFTNQAFASLFVQPPYPSSGHSHLGIYDTLDSAQASAHQALGHVVANNDRAGLSGTYHNHITGKLWATVLIDWYGQEIVATEIEIHRVQFHPQIWILLEGEAMHRQNDRHAVLVIPRPLVRLSAKPDSQDSHTKNENCNHEIKEVRKKTGCNRLWAQFRIPVFSKREEGPFRDLHVHRDEMVWIRQTIPRPVGQVVLPQPNELEIDVKRNDKQQENGNVPVDAEEIRVHIPNDKREDPAERQPDSWPVYQGRQHSCPCSGLLAVCTCVGSGGTGK